MLVFDTLFKGKIWFDQGLIYILSLLHLHAERPDLFLQWTPSPDIYNTHKILSLHPVRLNMLQNP